MERLNLDKIRKRSTDGLKEYCKRYPLSQSSRIKAYTDYIYDSDKDTIALCDELERLRVERKAEEQGRHVILPCKAGDIVYNIIPNRNIISTLKVTVVLIYENGLFFKWDLIDGIYNNVRGFGEDELGKTVFLAYEEAEAALKANE